MMLEELTSVPSAALPVNEFKDHLRLGSGFADDGLQDSVLEAYLRAAIAAIEARTGKVLIARDFAWTLTAWRDGARQNLPVAPIRAITDLRVVDAGEQATVIEPQSYRLQADGHIPVLAGAGCRLPMIPRDGSTVVSFTAGYGATWTDLPPDLGQAVFLLGAHFYENRAVISASDTAMPFGVSLLIDRYRRIRLFGEGGR